MSEKNSPNIERAKTPEILQVSHPGSLSVPENLAFCFSHDRIHIAALEALPEDVVSVIHVKIATFLEEQGNYNFDVATHLNKAIGILDDTEIERLMHLNITAANEARNKLAFSQVCLFLELRNIHAYFLGVELHVGGRTVRAQVA